MCVSKALPKLRTKAGERLVSKGLYRFPSNRFPQPEAVNYGSATHGIYLEFLYFLLAIVRFESLKYFLLVDFKGWSYIIYANSGQKPWDHLEL